MSKIQLTLALHDDGKPQLMFSCNNQNAINISSKGLKFGNSNINGVKNRFEYGVTKAKDVTKLNLFVHTTQLLPHITWASSKLDTMLLGGGGDKKKRQREERHEDFEYQKSRRNYRDRSRSQERSRSPERYRIRDDYEDRPPRRVAYEDIPLPMGYQNMPPRSRVVSYERRSDGGRSVSRDSFASRNYDVDSNYGDYRYRPDYARDRSRPRRYRRRYSDAVYEDGTYEDGGADDGGDD